MGVFSALENWARIHTGATIGVVFHSSCEFFCPVSETEVSDLQKLKDKYGGRNDVGFYMLSDWAAESTLMQKSPVPYDKRASSQLLNLTQTVNFSLKDVKQNPAAFLSAIGKDIVCFVFCEPSAAQDCCDKIGKAEGFYVLSFRNSYDSAIPMQIGGYSVRHDAVSLLPDKGTPVKYSPTDRFTIGSNTVTYKDMEKDKNVIGGEADIYRCSAFPGKLIKLYKKYLPSDEKVRKLEKIKKYAHIFPECAFPLELVRHNGTTVGFLMKEITDAKPYYTVVDSSNMASFIESLTLLLLRLRLWGFVYTDISLRNVLCTKDGKARLIDCDSMQAFCWPGDWSTPPFAHPDIDAFHSPYPCMKHRKAEHFDFSYAVLLFNILTSIDHPYQQKTLAGETPSWLADSFPYGYDKNGSPVKIRDVHDTLFANWSALDKDVRTAFVDSFTKDRNNRFSFVHSLGSWLRILEI